MKRSKQHQKDYGSVLAFATLLILGGLLVLRALDIGSWPDSLPQPPFQFQNRIKTDRSSSSSERLSSSKQKLFQSVLLTCVKVYHRDSCLHYLILCGSECKSLTSKSTFLRAREDYWALVNSRGLTPRDSTRQLKN
ncbi:MAG: hypothetical protein AB7F86_19110 [Bdellovibrionales bacterium]